MALVWASKVSLGTVTFTLSIRALTQTTTSQWSKTALWWQMREPEYSNTWSHWRINMKKKFHLWKWRLIVRNPARRITPPHYRPSSQIHRRHLLRVAWFLHQSSPCMQWHKRRSHPLTTAKFLPLGPNCTAWETKIKTNAPTSKYPSRSHPCNTTSLSRVQRGSLVMDHKG